MPADGNKSVIIQIANPVQRGTQIRPRIILKKRVREKFLFAFPVLFAAASRVSSNFTPLFPSFQVVKTCRAQTLPSLAARTDRTRSLDKTLVHSNRGRRQSREKTVENRSLVATQILPSRSSKKSVNVYRPKGRQPAANTSDFPLMYMHKAPAPKFQSTDRQSRS